MVHKVHKEFKVLKAQLVRLEQMEFKVHKAKQVTTAYKGLQVHKDRLVLAVGIQMETE